LHGDLRIPSFPLRAEDANAATEVVLRGGEAVQVVGASHRRGHLLVEHKNHHFHVPYQFLELKSGPSSTGNGGTNGPAGSSASASSGPQQQPGVDI